MRMLPLAEKLSFLARGVVCNEPGTNAVFGSTVSLKVTPVASSPVAPMTTVYLSVSPGSALVSRSLSTCKKSVFVAVTVGTNGTAGVGGSKTRFTAAWVVEFFATSGLLAAGLLGSAFLDHPARLDSTETEKTTAAKMATVAISTGTERFDLIELVLFEVLRMLRLRITRARV